jgi:hypothetical protein
MRIAKNHGWGRRQRSPIGLPQRQKIIIDSTSEALQLDLAPEWPWLGKANHILRCIIPSALTFALSGCGAQPKLPDCLSGLAGGDEPNATAATKKPLKIGKQVLIGIDGSGSMLGYSQADKSINQGTLRNGLQPVTYRIGGGVAEGPIGASVTQAADPCFFKGCSGFKPVASSLETLWTLERNAKVLPLRLLVSDLEVNQNDITAMLSSIQVDLAKGASAGVLGVKAPFKGNVFSSDGQIIYKGSTNRPVFILATGHKEQVSSVLNEIRKTLASKGVNGAQVSIIASGSIVETMKAQWVIGVPPERASTEGRIQIGGKNYYSAQNPEYQFIRLDPGFTGISVATTKKWTEGAERPDFGIADLERLSITGSQTLIAGGMQITSIQISGLNIKVGIDVDNSVESGLYRVVIPAGSLPEQWWLEWDRPEAEKTKLGEKTEGFLPLMTDLSEQIAETVNAPPAAVMCIALQN